MKQGMFTVVAVMATIAAWQVSAHEYVVPDVEIISVVPRSPDVKPYMMSLPAEGRTEHVKTPERTPVATVANEPTPRKPEQTASAQQK
jgi:hypothetical protein